MLIGPNASGKSNLIEALSLFEAMPVDLTDPIKDGGGVRDWLWRGAKRPIALLEAVVANPKGKQSLRHGFEFTENGQRFEMVDEWIEDENPNGRQKSPDFYYRFRNRPTLEPAGAKVAGQVGNPGSDAAMTPIDRLKERMQAGHLAQLGSPVLNVNGSQKRTLRREDVSPDQSIVAQRRDPDTYPEITFLANQYARISLYRDWAFGRNTIARTPQKIDERNDQLLPDYRNLALMVNKLKRNRTAKLKFIELLETFIHGVTDLDVQLEGGTAQLFLEEGSFSVPATRLSDGTLRFICLIVILLNPDPPPLVCIEEPELGLHPDAITVVGEQIIEASTRTQLIITTHSDILLDAMSEQPESVIVCERSQGETYMRRLTRERLAPHLTDQTLSQLWHSGEIGGNRW